MILVTVFEMVILFVGFTVIPQSLQGSKTNYCKWVLRSTNERDVFISAECRKAGAWGTVTITEVERKILNCKNHSQSNLVAAYNANRAVPDRDKIDPKQGVCWAAATVSLLEFYGASTSPHTKPTVNDMFYKTVKNARDKVYITHNLATGLPTGYQDDVLQDMFDQYRVTRYKTGYNFRDSEWIYSWLKETINKGEACIFSIPEHEMPGCGYIRFKASYYTKTSRIKPVEKYFDFVVVNDTWDESGSFESQYSYYPAELIDTRFLESVVLDRSFCLTTVIEK